MIVIILPSIIGAVKLILFVIMVIVIYPLIAYILYDKSSIRPEIIDTTLRLAGVITIIFIGITVHYTGGMEKSMLSSYFFLYLLQLQFHLMQIKV